MARPGITYHDVAEAAKQLIQRGDKVTIDRVRLMLKRGSDATISKHLQEWRRQCEVIIGEGFREIPSDMVEESVTQLWSKLNANAKTRYEQLEFFSEEQINSLTLENKALEEEKQALADLLEKAQQKINNIDAEIQFLKRDLVQERQRREVETMRANKAEELAATLQSETKSHIDDLKQLYESQIAVLHDQYQKDKTDFHSGLTQYKDLLENMRGNLMVTSDKHQIAEKQVAQLEAELKRQQELTQNWVEKARALEVDLTIAKEQNNTVR
jgi:chromosome segregation ATPase